MPVSIVGVGCLNEIAADIERWRCCRRQQPPRAVIGHRLDQSVRIGSGGDVPCSVVVGIAALHPSYGTSADKSLLAMADKTANIALSIARRANQRSHLTSIPAFKAMTIEEKFSFGIKLICPVQSSLQKEICSHPLQITSTTRPVSSHRGAYRDRHGRGAACGGRGWRY